MESGVISLVWSGTERAGPRSRIGNTIKNPKISVIIAVNIGIPIDDHQIRYSMAINIAHGHANRAVRIVNLLYVLAARIAIAEHLALIQQNRDEGMIVRGSRIGVVGRRSRSGSGGIFICV